MAILKFEKEWIFFVGYEIWKLLQKWNHLYVTGESTEIYKQINSYSVIYKLCVKCIIKFEDDTQKQNCHTNLMTVTIVSFKYREHILGETLYDTYERTWHLYGFSADLRMYLLVIFLK
jgi:hypothetical protein